MGCRLNGLLALSLTHMMCVGVGVGCEKSPVSRNEWEATCCAGAVVASSGERLNA